MLEQHIPLIALEFLLTRIFGVSGFVPMKEKRGQAKSGGLGIVLEWAAGICAEKGQVLISLNGLKENFSKCQYFSI